jgi:type II secretory pathway pseudopilin PulG
MRRRAFEQGFTFIGVLILVAIAGVALAGAGQLWSTAAKRDKEAQLLFVGDEFRRAIGSYYESSPGVKQFPQKLEELLEDRRVPTIRRHLRQIYRDPMTDKRDWDLVMIGDRIIGVHSKSKDKPLKTGNFKPEDEAFKEASAYTDWQFTYQPASAVPGSAASTAGGQPQPGASTARKTP